MIVGNTYNFRTEHPADFVEALYREVFVNHPDNSEIDVAIVVADNPTNKGVMRIVDLKVFRVSTENEQRYKGFSGDSPIDMMREMVAWAKSHGPESQFLWLHKHPEGMATPSVKDDEWNVAMAAIDFSQSNGAEKRCYIGGAVVNRTASTAFRPPRDLNDLTVGIPEIDAGVIMEAWRRLSADLELPADHRSHQIIRDLCDAAVRKDDEALARHIPDLMALFPELKAMAMARDMARAAAKQDEQLKPFEIAIPANIAEILGLPQMMNAADNFELPKINLPKTDRLN